MTIRLKLLGGGIAISLLLSVVLVLAILSFDRLSGGFAEVVGKSTTGVNNSLLSAAKVSKTDAHLAEVSSGMLQLADDISQTNMHVKILQRKFRQVSGSLQELLEGMGEVSGEIPETWNEREQLDELTDVLGDIEEIVRREALISLKTTVGKMKEFSTRLDGQVQEIGTLTGQLAEVKSLSSDVVTANQEIQSLSQQFDGQIEISRNVDNINDVSKRTAQGARKAAASSEELAGYSRQVQGVLRQFKI